MNEQTILKEGTEMRGMVLSSNTSNLLSEKSRITYYYHLIMINDFSSSEDSEQGQKVVQKPVNIWGSLFTQVQSPKETHGIPVERA